MPTLADLFPNLAKLKKDDAPGAAIDARDDFGPRDRSRSRPPARRPRPPVKIGSRKEPTLKVGGPTRSKRSGARRAPSRDAAWTDEGLVDEMREPFEAREPFETRERFEAHERFSDDAERSSRAGDAFVAVPAADLSDSPSIEPAGGVPKPFALPADEQIQDTRAADAPPVQERRLGAERRSGFETRAGGERRYGVEARSGRDRRSEEDPRSGTDLRSGADRRRATAEQSAGFSPLASAARFGIDKLSAIRRPGAPASGGGDLGGADLGGGDLGGGDLGGGDLGGGDLGGGDVGGGDLDGADRGGPGLEPAERQADAGFSPLASAARFVVGKVSGARRSDRPARDSQRDPVDAASDVDTAAGASIAKRPARSRRPSRGGAPNLAKLGSLGSLKNMNVSLGRRGGRGNSLVGLDIQPGYVAAVEADVNGVVAVKRAVGLALPPDTMRDGEVIDPTLLAEVLRELFAHGGLSKRVRVGLANQRTVVRTMELPPIEDRKELAAAVRFQAQDQIPMPLANAVLDFQPLGIVETPAGKRQRVVVVAAQREMVERLVSAVSAAGLRPEAVDLSAFAMIRALYRPDEAGRQLPSTAPGQPVAADAETNGGSIAEPEAAASQGSRTLFLNVGGLTNLAIAEGATCRFTRAVGGGLESMAGALAERRNMPLVDARKLISSFDLTRREARIGSPPGAPVAPAVAMSSATPLSDAPGIEAPTERPGEAGSTQGLPVQGLPAQGLPAGALAEPEPSPASAEVRAVIAGGLREIAGEVRNSLDYHRAQESGGTVDSVVVSGAALEINGFASALEAELGFRVQRRSVASSRGGELNHTPAERLAIAAGLAVEEVAR